MISPFHDYIGAIGGSIKTGGAIRHTKPTARDGIERKVLAEDVGGCRVAVRDRMIRAIKGDADVGSGRASNGFLSCGSCCCATALRAARHAAGIAANSTDNAAFDGQHGAAAQRDHQTTLLDKLLNVGEAFPTDSAGNVIGFGGSAMAGSLCCFLE